MTFIAYPGITYDLKFCVQWCVESYPSSLYKFEKKKGIDYGFALPTCSLMIDKYCFDKFGYFDLNLKRVEDMDMTIRLSMGNVKFLSAKEPTTSFKIEAFFALSSESSLSILTTLSSEIRAKKFSSIS